MLLNKTKSWHALQQHQQQIASLTLVDLFQANPSRFTDFSLEFSGLLMDYSKQRVTAETMQLLGNLANEQGLRAAIDALFKGAIVNHSEQRAALHTELRHPDPAKTEVKQVLEQMRKFVNYVHSGEYTDVIVLGIGGSDLGPRLVCQALEPFGVSDLQLHFIANVDGDTLSPLLQQLDPKTTLVIINSKTFTTVETLANAKLIKQWFAHTEHLTAVTTNKGKALAFGISPERIFEFWDWVGGRYSVWSAVGLSIALTIGMDNFTQFLAGAHAMDQHFYSADFSQNMPVLMALIGIWNINFNNYTTLAIKPYSDALGLLPAYLQQLEMESNGKSVAAHGGMVEYQTAPVIWGGVGCNGQHAYMQLLHQGTQVIPVDFLVARQSVNGPAELHNLLVASCLGQSQALMTGRADAEQHKSCPGNKPSTTLMFDKLTPNIIGKIIALYEHKVFVQGVIWQINSFDQWGVQLGKELIDDVLQLMQPVGDKSRGAAVKVDGSTAGLLDYFFAK